MIRLFRTQPVTAIQESVSTQEVSTAQTTNEIIQEIHDTFYTEVDRLLESAKIMRSEDTDLQELINKSKRLKSLGFGQTKECVEADAEVARLLEVQKENESNRKLVEAINHFQMRYPIYKFISEASVQKICQKYNLVYGDVKNYKGTVPEKNLREMESFKIRDEDKAYLQWFSTGFIDIDPRGRSRFSEKDTVSHDSYQMIKRGYESDLRALHSSGYRVCPAPLEIAAPLSDFDTSNMEVNNFKLSEIEIPDPIVLQPVYFAGMKYYLVVTAWGIESEDEQVVNEKMN